jgi:O-antigen/teichoic acid export membrane protein
MGIVTRQGSRNTLILFAGIGIGFINEFLLLRNFLGEEQVGLIKLLVQVSALLVQFAALGGTNTVLRFFPFYRDESRSHGGFLFGMFSLLAFGLALVSLALLLFQEPIKTRYALRSPLFVEYFYLLFPLLAFNLTFVLLEAYSKSRLRTVAPTLIQEVILRLGVTLSVSAYIFQWIDTTGFYYAFTAVNCLTAVWLIAWLAWKGELKLRPNTAFYQPQALSKLLGYGLLTMLSAFASRFYTSIDSIMLGDLVGLDAVAVYLTGGYLASLITAPGRSILRVSAPLVANHWKSGDMEAMRRLFAQVTGNNLILTCGMYLLLLAAAPALLSIIPPTYAGAMMVFLILGAGRIADMGTALVGVILMTSRYHYWVFGFNVLMAGLAVLGNALLIPKMGINGAAIATASTIAIINALRMAFVEWHFKLWPYRIRHAILVFWTAGFAALLLWLRAPFSTWLESMELGFWVPWVAAAMMGVLVLLLYALPVLKSGWAPELNTAWQRAVTRMIKGR